MSLFKVDVVCPVSVLVSWGKHLSFCLSFELCIALHFINRLKINERLKRISLVWATWPKKGSSVVLIHLQPAFSTYFNCFKSYLPRPHFWTKVFFSLVCLCEASKQNNNDDNTGDKVNGSVNSGHSLCAMALYDYQVADIMAIFLPLSINNIFWSNRFRMVAGFWTWW